MVAGQSFGHRVRAAFGLEPGLTYLNHGAFGAVPLSVAEAQAGWRRRIEANPTRFFSDDGPEAIRAAARGLARRFGGRGRDWAFVTNATTGVSTVLDSLRIGAGDVILTTDLAYPSVLRALHYFTARAGAELRIASLPVPLPGPEPVLDTVAEALSDGAVRFALFDHIASPTGAVLPVAELAALCRRHGVPVLVDGAHAPGQLPLDVPAIGAAAYVGNLHKWCFAPRGAGMLWVDPQFQGRIEPPVIAKPLDEGFPRSFDYLGTFDPSAWLAVGDGFAFADIWGADAIASANAALARRAGLQLAAAWDTESATAPDMAAALAAIRLPLDGERLRALAERHGDLFRAGRAVARGLRERHRIEVPVVPHRGLLWVRVSAQIYNEMEDSARLVTALPQELAAQ